jgi:nicotinamide-nucleotide amidase
VGLAAHAGSVDVRIAARAATEAVADQMIAEMEAEVCARIGDDSIFGTGSDEIERVTAELLARAGVKVAIVESATAGDVARLLCGTPEGVEVVTAAYVVGGPEALSALLPLSLPQLEAFEWVSKMTAAAAAAALIDTYEGSWGLAVLGDMGAQGDVYSGDTGQTYVALATPESTEVGQYPYAGSGFLSRRWVSLRAIDLLRRQALARLAAYDRGEGL